MKVSELRIGNLVTIDNPKAWANLKGTILVVANIESMLDAHFPDSTGTVGLKGGPKFIERIHQFDEFIQPITLTEEWLLKFGFEASNIYEEFYEYRKDGHRVQTEGLNFIWMGYGDGVEIKYVHQLQNLFFSLTGKELVASI